MSKTIGSNKYFVSVLVISLVLGGLTFGNLPGPTPPTGIQTIGGVTFNFADYGALTFEEIAIFNYLDTITSAPYGNWDAFYIYPDVYHLLHYHLAFMSYSLAMMFQTTPGYRTTHYSDVAYDVIKRMNTTEVQYHNNSIEAIEWTRTEHAWPNWTDYYYPDPINPDADDVYTGGFRGPANIMWTAHYALMELFYERSFNTGEFYDEYTWYMNDWNNSLTTDGLNNSREGGIWECGLIPCQPYSVWVQCNSIPVFFTELYDNMYGTDYMPIWDYGLWFANNILQDEYGLFSDEYYVQRPMGYIQPDGVPTQQFPGQMMDPYFTDGRPYVSGYGTSWSLLFLEYTQENETIADYPKFIDLYGKEISGDKMYFVDNYNYVSGFGAYDMLSSLFTLGLAKQRGDFVTRDRILNFLYDLYNKEWSADGREMHWNSLAIEPFLQSSLAYGWLWANTPVTIKDLAEPRPTEFWDYPYISAADDDGIWVYQAEWDPSKEGFILNIRVDQAATLTFSNFGTLPTAYAGGVALTTLEAAGANLYELTLQPGTYQLVIM